MLFLELLAAVRHVLSGPAHPRTGAGSPARLGRLLFSGYLYPFEITSILLLAALVGALAVAGKKEPS
jgi:NADH-quinone oxidoreductase subunit J